MTSFSTVGGQPKYGEVRNDKERRSIFALAYKTAQNASLAERLREEKMKIEFEKQLLQMQQQQQAQKSAEEAAMMMRLYGSAPQRMPEGAPQGMGGGMPQGMPQGMPPEAQQQMGGGMPPYEEMGGMPMESEQMGGAGEGGMSPMFSQSLQGMPEMMPEEEMY